MGIDFLSPKRQKQKLGNPRSVILSGHLHSVESLSVKLRRVYNSLFIISFINASVVDKELYFLWNHFKMAENAIISLFSDLLTSFSTLFLTMKIEICLVDHFWNTNRSSVSFCIIYLTSLATNYFLSSQCHPFIYFFYVSSDTYIKALLSMYAFRSDWLEHFLYSTGRKQPLKTSL